MTEQQFEDLKLLLDRSPTPPNSEQLDKQIIGAARRRASDVKLRAKTNNRVVELLRQFSSNNAVATVAVSLTVTFVVFSVMSQMAFLYQAPDQNSVVGTKDTSQDQRRDNSADIAISIEQTQQASKAAASSDAIPRIAQAPMVNTSRLSKNEILADLVLPTAETLLQGAEFSKDGERALASASVTTALTDINNYIRQGKLENARDRYDRLRRSCMACSLPSTLDALALGSRTQQSRI